MKFNFPHSLQICVVNFPLRAHILTLATAFVITAVTTNGLGFPHISNSHCTFCSEFFTLLLFSGSKFPLRHLCKMAVLGHCVVFTCERSDLVVWMFLLPGVGRRRRRPVHLTAHAQRPQSALCDVTAVGHVQPRQLTQILSHVTADRVGETR